MELIETVTVDVGGETSIEFTDIPQDGSDLMAVCSYNATASGGFEFDVYLNGVGNTVRRLYGTGTAVGSGSNDQISVTNSEYPTTNTFHSLQMYVSNYTASAQHSFSVDAIVEANSSASWGSYQAISAGLNSSTSPVTSLKFQIDYPAFAQYSTASLYKITSGSDGTTTVT